MRRTHALLRVVACAGLAAGGLLAGHAIGYAIAVPDDYHRVALMARTGHSYLPSASWAAIVLGIAASVAGVASGYRRHGGRRRYGVAFLAGLQVGGFLVLEVVERVVSGAPLHTLSVSLLVIGVAAQIVVGILLALLAAGLVRAGAALAAAVAPTTRRAKLAGHPVPWSTPRAVAASRTRRLGRAPPRLRTS